MRFFTFSMLALLSASAAALEFKITIYNNVDDCVANPETTYRIITGTSDSECHTFDEAMPNTDCEQYIRGGWDNMGCDSSSLLPRSVFVRNDKKVCYLFNESHCQGRRRAAVEDGCKAAKVNDGESENFKSFRCSDMILPVNLGPPSLRARRLAQY